LRKQKTKPLKPDPVLNGFWSDNHRFADLFNQVLFQGEAVIDPEQLAEQDTEESTAFWEKEHLDAILKSRDVIKQHVNGTRLVLIGLENQMRIHYAMPVRNMLYDSLRYTRQCKTLEQFHRREKDLKDPDEFLSGMAKTDRIQPVISLIVYYGEKAWDGPYSLRDMMDVPSDFEPYINNQRINLLEVSQAGTLKFRHEDNQDFFVLMKAFYDNKGKLDLDIFNDQFSEKEVYWETMAAIGAATGSGELIEYAQQNKGGYINMCTALENFKKENIQEGLEKGLEKGLQKGLQEGMQKNMVYLIRENFSENIAPDEIASFLKLDRILVKRVCEKIQTEPKVTDEDLIGLLFESR